MLLFRGDCAYLRTLVGAQNMTGRNRCAQDEYWENSAKITGAKDGFAGVPGEEGAWNGLVIIIII